MTSIVIRTVLLSFTVRVSSISKQLLNMCHSEPSINNLNECHYKVSLLFTAVNYIGINQIY